MNSSHIILTFKNFTPYCAAYYLHNSIEIENALVLFQQNFLNENNA